MTEIRRTPVPEGHTLQHLTRFSCTYCNVSFPDKRDLQVHCQSESHQRTIMSDEGHDWFYRPPPRGMSVESYSLCDSWNETGACRFGFQCVEAHGLEELMEWKERLEYRCMKLKRAGEKELSGASYTEDLLKKWVTSCSPNSVMCGNVTGVEVVVSGPLGTTMVTKNCTHEWVFAFKTAKRLHAVALLEDTHRNHFYLQEIATHPSTALTANQQEWIVGKNVRAIEPNGLVQHHIVVGFKTEIFGTFRQSVVFDFGTEPVLVKHLSVDVIPVSDADRVNEIRKEILPTTDRWNPYNSCIIPFRSNLPGVTPTYASFEDDWHDKLKSMYPCPQLESFVLSHATVTEKRFTPNNYRARMHELLYVEEMARTELVSRYNLLAKLQVTHSYMLSPNGMASTTAKYSADGELFALMHLSKELSEDTAEGRLILGSCHTVLVSLEQAQGNSERRVYEALIEDKGKKMIYLRFSTSTVNELKLQPDSIIQVQVQFQLNRIPYCEWHYAVDKICQIKFIFPETYLEPCIPWSPDKQWAQTLDKRLNLKQREAVVAITTPKHVQMPPILIIGPFGTGKTFTLAQAVKELMQEADNRVLICTHSNSAADLYVKDYLHPFAMSCGGEVKPLRVFYHKRWVSTVNPIVQKYALITEESGIRQFRPPTLEDITSHRITVVTLSVSMYLAGLGLPHGFFTHILLDEAAQALECETIMPLALANENTRIVLAGDHMQLSPDLFSDFSRERNLHVSLLERLYDYYPGSFSCKILLCENYRAHEAIIKFTSESFYDQKLVAKGSQPRHDSFYPLTFFTSRGEDVQDQNSTAFYNNSEVYEIVERVCELAKRWPKAWGKMDEHSIGIVTPYSDQVFRIRSELRKRRMASVSVERVLNVQGKQFRAIFLSTVRTRRTCGGKKASDDDYGFLSNSKLLNTAITRAQSLVAVVGDPVALCTIGRCSKVWERFVQICNENKSLFGMTWSLLRSQLDGIELKKTYVLNPLAPEFVPRKIQQERYLRSLQFVPNGGLCPPRVNFVPVTPLPVLTPFCPVNPAAFVAKPPIPIPTDGNPVLLNPLNVFTYQNNQMFSPPPIALKTDDGILSDYFSLLPENMSLVEMLLQHHTVQERWFYHLLETRGLHAAKKFEYLILTSKTTSKSKETPQTSTDTQDLCVNKPHFSKKPIEENFSTPVENPTNWQQQINEDFANLSINNNETIDDLYRRYEKGLTYAGVVKNSKSASVNGATSADELTGQRLYKYFS